MLWIKIALSCLIVAFGALLGWLWAGKSRARSKFYAQMYDFNERYLDELGYARKPLPVFLRDFPATGDFKKLLETFACTRAPQQAASYLTKDERKECEDYFSMLGRGDAQSQSGYFGARREALAAKKMACERDAKERCALGVKLGLLGGLAFVILII